LVFQKNTLSETATGNSNFQTVKKVQNLRKATPLSEAGYGPVITIISIGYFAEFVKKRINIIAAMAERKLFTYEQLPSCWQSKSTNHTKAKYIKHI